MTPSAPDETGGTHETHGAHGTHGVPAATPAPQDPWDRYGWLMGAIWLVFLAFPLVGAITSDRPASVRAAAIVAICVFGAAYLAGFLRSLSLHARWLPDGPIGWYLVMAALAILTAALIGGDAIGMCPFLVAYAAFVMPRPAAIVAVIATFAGAAAYTTAIGWWSDIGFLFAVMALIATIGTIVGSLEAAEETHRVLRRDHELVSERERMARDVHDVLGHSLTVVAVKAELAGRLVDADPARAKAELAAIQRLARTSLGEIRATVSGLRVARLDEELSSAEQALSGAGIDATVPQDVTVVDPRHRLVLAWVLREAVTNVVRHSDADACTVAFGADWLTVSDDGRGSAVLRHGNGLRGIRERVTAAGGMLTVTSTAGVGTTVEVRW